MKAKLFSNSNLRPVSRVTCVVLVLFGLGNALHLAQAESKPNIIYLLADDLGYSELGCYGQTKIRTPRLDRMASEGMRFTQHYAGSPVCASSRCVLLTGKHTGHSTIRGNDEWPKGVDVWADRTIEGQRPLLEDTYTLGKALQNAGYITGAFGKWGLGTNDTSGSPNKQGFDSFYGYLCQRQAHNHYPTHLWRNQERHVLEGNVQGNVIGKHYAHDYLVEEALAFVRRHHTQPFFLYVPFHIPHVAIQVPEDSLKEYQGAFPEEPYTGDRGYLPHPTPRAAYAAMITRMDRDIGRLFDLLKELNLDDNTVTFFSSDNGPTYAGGADSDFFDGNGPLRGLKGEVYEGGIRVPMIARWPGKIQPGQVTDHVSAFWDVFPTLAEIAGAKPATDGDGISFLPTLLNQSHQKTHDYLYWEYPERGGSKALRQGDWKLVQTGIKQNPNAPYALYRLDQDLGESKNIADLHPDKLAELIQTMKSARFPAIIDKWNYPSAEVIR